MTHFFRHIYLLSFFSVASFLLIGCDEQEYQSIEGLDEQNIQQYISQNNLNMLPYGSTGIHFQVLEEGDLDKPLAFSEMSAMVFTMRSLDGSYVAEDTLYGGNRYYDFLGYYPYGNTSTSNLPSSPVESENSIKNVLLEGLQYANGRIRVLIPSRYLYGRNGNSSLGIPANASMDYVFHLISPSDVPAYEAYQIERAINSSAVALDEYERTESGIYYHIIEMGEGEAITSGATVTVAYVGRFLDGTEFDSSDSATFALFNLAVSAWPEIVPKINKGGKVEFYAPSPTAYGAAGSGSIPQFTPLYFEITVREDEEE